MPFCNFLKRFYCLGLLFVTLSAFADLPPAEVLFDKIHPCSKELQWITGDSAEVHENLDKTKGLELFVVLEWTSKGTATNFLFANEVVHSSKNHPDQYQVHIPLTGQTTQAKVLSVSPDGSICEEDVKIQFPLFERIRGGEKPKQSPFSISSSLGPTYLKLDQTGYVGAIEWALTFQLQMNYRIGTLPLSMGASGWATPVTLSSNRSDVSVSVFGGETYLSYHLPWPHSPWSLILSSGAYYSTLNVTQNLLGYRNLLALQLFPVLSYEFKRGDQLALAFKYSPILNNSTFSFSNHVMNIQLRWLHPFREASPHGLIVGMNWTSIQYFDSYSFFAGNVRLQTAGMQVGYQW